MKKQRAPIFVELEGQRVRLVDAAAARGIDYGTVYARLRAGVRGAALFSKVSKRATQGPRLKRRQQVADLVRAGWSNFRIRTELACGPGLIADVRRELGIPATAQFALPTKPVAPKPAPAAASTAKAEGYKHLTPQDLAQLRGRARALRWGDFE